MSSSLLLCSLSLCLHHPRSVSHPYQRNTPSLLYFIRLRVSQNSQNLLWCFVIFVGCQLGLMVHTSCKQTHISSSVSLGSFSLSSVSKLFPTRVYRVQCVLLKAKHLVPSFWRLWGFWMISLFGLAWIEVCAFNNRWAVTAFIFKKKGAARTMQITTLVFI